MWRALQLTLDLFAAKAPEAAPQPKAAPAPASVDTQPLAPESAPIAAAPAIALREAMLPACFAHPRGNRQARLAEAVVSYELRRSHRRTIGFAVDADGLVVTAPRWVPVAEIERALHEKAPWIVRKLGEMRERRQRVESARIDWRDGCELPYLGQRLCVRLDPQAPSAGTRHDLIDSAQPGWVELRLGLPQHSEPAQIRDAVQAWLMREARRVFIERLQHFAPQLGVSWRRLGLSNASTRWGSAGADGSIRLNWRLVHFAMPVIDYVVVHELSHLRVLDHSPRFWGTVAEVLPDYAQRREQLRDDAIPRWG